MSKFISELKKIYEEEKDLKNPPKYLKTIKKILEIDNRLNKEKTVSGGWLVCCWIDQKGDFPMTININHHSPQSQSKIRTRFFENPSSTVVFEITVFLSFLLSYLLTKISIYIYIYTDSAGENVIFSKFSAKKCHFLGQLEVPWN